MAARWGGAQTNAVVHRGMAMPAHYEDMPLNMSSEILHNRSRVPDLVRRIQANDPKLAQVVVWNSSLGSEGITMLAEALKNNTVVKSISLSYTGCGAAGAHALAAGLAGNRTVTELKLTNNAIGDDGAAAMAQLLSTHPTISTVELTGNSIGEIGGRHMADAIRANNPAFLSLDLSENRLNEAAARAIADAMQANRSIKSLALVRPTAVSINMPRNTPFSPMAIDIINKGCLRNRGTPPGLAAHPKAVRGLRPDGWGPAHTRGLRQHITSGVYAEKVEGDPVHHRLAHERHHMDQDVDYGIYPTQVYDRRFAREHMSQPLALF